MSYERKTYETQSIDCFVPTCKDACTQEYAIGYPLLATVGVIQVLVVYVHMQSPCFYAGR